MFVEPEIIYLHGLGSSPGSVKARLVSDFYRSRGRVVHTPTLAIPSFDRLSVHGVIESVVEAVRSVPSDQGVFLIGSSFGGFAATHAFHRLSDRERRGVRGVVLLAPVFYPWHESQALLTPEVETRWKREGWYPLPESETGKEVLVHYRFVEELRSYDSNEVVLSVPTLIVHGTKDGTVSHQQSVEFSRRQPNAQLLLLDDDHQLTADKDGLVSIIHRFIERA
jgi:pimeloyl-ACP methyl ester carboxylesterase